MKIALISFHSSPLETLGEKDAGGMNVYIQRLSQGLNELDHSVDIFSRAFDSESANIEFQDENKFESIVRNFHFNAGPYDLKKSQFIDFVDGFVEKVISFCNKTDLKYDLISSHYWLSAIIGQKLSDYWQIPHVTTFHTLAEIKLSLGVEDGTDLQFRSKSEKEIIQRVDAIVVSTDLEKQDLILKYGAPETKIHSISPGVNLDLFKSIDRSESRRILNLDLQENIVLFVGRIDSLKGIDYLVEAMRQLGQKFPFRLQVVGGSLDASPELNELKSKIQEADLTDRVDIIGSVSQEKLVYYYNSCDIFVMPSLHESFGLAALEAMACGIPVVVSDVGGLKTFVTDSETGFLVAPANANEIAVRIALLLENDSLRNQIGEKAQIEARSRTWEITSREIALLYSNLVKSPNI